MTSDRPTILVLFVSIEQKKSFVQLLEMRLKWADSPKSIFLLKKSFHVRCHNTAKTITAKSR